MCTMWTGRNPEPSDHRVCSSIQPTMVKHPLASPNRPEHLETQVGDSCVLGESVGTLYPCPGKQEKRDLFWLMVSKGSFDIYLVPGV